MSAATGHTVCFGCTGYKPVKRILCNDCWDRVPFALREKFLQPASNGEKRSALRSVMMAARSLARK